MTFEVKRNLKKWRWKESGPFRWKHEVIGETIDLQGPRENKEKLMQKVGESFRNTKWDKYMSSERHDVEPYMDTVYPKDRAKAIRSKEWGGDDRCIPTGVMNFPTEAEDNHTDED